MLVRKNGRVTLLQHDIPIPTLAAEFQMLDMENRKKFECLFVASLLVDQEAHSMEIPLNVRQLLDTSPNTTAAVPPAVTPTEVRFRRVGTAPDPFRFPMHQRLSPTVFECAYKTLKNLPLRSTKYVGHDVFITLLKKGNPSAKCAKRPSDEKDRAPRVKTVGRRSRLHDSWVQVLHVTLVEKHWARIWNLGAAVVNGKQFVLEVIKERSKKDLRVKYFRQGRDYNIAVESCDILRGSDGVWRRVKKKAKKKPT